MCAACPAELGSYPGATRCFPSILAAGSCLNAGDALVDSCSGSHLAMEGNGNLVLYDSDMSVVLNFSTAPLGARACMYTSGNFAVLDGSGSVVWSMSPGLGTPAFTPGSGVYLILQWDHSLMAYDGTNNLLATVYSGLGVGRLFSTGVDASGHLLQEGDSDPHYLYACCGNSYAYSPDVHAFTPFIFRYFADHPNWIYDYTVSGDAHSIYRTTFTATPAHSVHVTADCDDDCTLWLNNVQVGSSGGFWSQNGTISLNLNGLKCGLNTLEARVHNLPGVGPSGVAIVATYLNAVPCAAGSFASGTGSLYCTPCPAGTWASATGANSSAICKPCPAGTWSSATGANSAASCKPCPSGSFCPQFSTIPHNCPAPLTCSTSTLSDCGLLVNNGSFDLNGLFYYDLGFDSFCLQPSSTYLPSSNYEVKLYRANTGVSITVTASVVSNPFSNTVLYLISDNSDWGSYVPDCSTLADSPSLLLTARGISINNRVTLPYGYGMLGCFSTDDSEPTVPGGAYLAIEYAYCTAGSYCPYGTVQGNETLCPPGTFSLDGAAVCTPCPAGTWSSATGATFSLNEATVCTPCGCPSSCLAGATADVSSCSATPTFSPTRSPSPSVTVTPSATPSPLACAPGSFVAPGTYFCSRCPANSIAPYAGPTTSCDPCPRPLVANVNATSCAFCPLHMRTNGTACAPCPADMWCESGRELPCLVPGQCLGDLQGCRAGHIGFLCGSCAPHFYKAPTNFCAPCGVEMWQALAWIGGAAAVAAAVTFLFYQQLREVVKGLLVVHNEHDARLSLLWDQVVRLALLNRLSVLPLPAEFKWALSFVGLVVGFNTATSATECASVGWAFAQKWGLVVGSVFGAMALALCADLYMRRTGNAIAIADWRVWDAMDVFIPLAVQACWQAMSSVAIDGKARLLSEPETLFDLYPHYYIYCASVTIVVINVCVCSFAVTTQMPTAAAPFTPPLLPAFLPPPPPSLALSSQFFYPAPLLARAGLRTVSQAGARRGTQRVHCGVPCPRGVGRAAPLQPCTARSFVPPLRGHPVTNVWRGGDRVVAHRRKHPGDCAAGEQLARAAAGRGCALGRALHAASRVCVSVYARGGCGVPGARVGGLHGPGVAGRGHCFRQRRTLCLACGAPLPWRSYSAVHGRHRGGQVAPAAAAGGGAAAGGWGSGFWGRESRVQLAPSASSAGACGGTSTGWQQRWQRCD